MKCLSRRTRCGMNEIEILSVIVTKHLLGYLDNLIGRLDSNLRVVHMGSLR